jgi:fatty-acyl-CoA synthase
MPPGPYLCYEDLIMAQDGLFDWPEFDERTPSSLCYTSVKKNQFLFIYFIYK